MKETRTLDILAAVGGILALAVIIASVYLSIYVSPAG